MSSGDNTGLIILVIITISFLLLGGAWLLSSYLKAKATQETAAKEKEEVVVTNKSTTESQVKKDSKTVAETQLEIGGVSPAPTSSTTSTSTIPSDNSSIYVETPVVTSPVTPRPPGASTDPVYLENEYEREYGSVHPIDRPPKFNYFFGKVCPQGYEDLGRAGILRPKTLEVEYPFPSGKEFDDKWTWAHPRLCKGYRKATRDGLYGLGDPAENTIPTRIWLGNNFVQDRELPESMSLVKYDDRWWWGNTSLVPATETMLASIADDATKFTDFRRSLSEDRIKILFAKEDLKNIKDITEIGDSYDDENTWIHPYLVNSNAGIYD